MESLETIQKLSKLGRILSKICFVFFVIMSCICIAGLFGATALPQESFELGETTIQGMVDIPQEIKESLTPEMTKKASVVALVVATIICISEAVLAKLAERYFKNELKAGTPFTFEGAKELKRLGICSILIPLGASVIAQIAIIALEKAIAGDIGDEKATFSLSLGTGIAMLVVSVICKYGAELRQRKPASTTAKK